MVGQIAVAESSGASTFVAGRLLLIAFDVSDSAPQPVNETTVVL